MTKRILAAFLAVMMVMALVPTSVFAANSNVGCVVTETYPDHSKIHCDNAGAKYTVVPDSTVEPKCGQDGYTLYLCECGEYFADDLVPMDPHHTESGEPKAERVEPTCYATGKAAIFTCDVCGNDYYDPTDPDADSKGIIAKTPHTFNQMNYPGNDCTASERVCGNEGCTAKDTTHKPQKEHHWVYADPEAIVQAPTAHDEGVATFKCDNAGCAQTKNVEVLPLDHKSSMKWVDEVERGDGCEDTGVKGHWHCTVCGKDYLEIQGVLVEADQEMLTIPAVGHTWSDTPYIFPATCTTWGFEYYGCQVCFIKGESKDLAPLGHTTYEEAVAHDADPDLVAADGLWITTTEGNCTSGTKYEWTCKNYADGVSGALCGEACSKQLKAPNHKEATIKVPATCAQPYSYTIVYCTNDFCTKPEVETATVKIGTKNVTLDVTVEVKDGDVYNLEAGNTLKVLRIDGAKAATATGHFYESRIINAPTCTDAGKKFIWCTGDTCNVNAEVDAEALGHVFLTTEEGLLNDTDATCTDDATQGCDRDGCTFVQTLPNTAHHTWGEEKAYTTQPTCTGGLGYDVFECTAAGCVEVDLRNETTFVENLSYETVEMAQAQHPGLSATYVELKKGDCENFGYWEYSCSDCTKNVLVKIADTGLGHKRPDTTVYHDKATCTQYQGWEAYVCDRCGDQVAAEIEVKELGHAMTTTAKKAATCLEGGNQQYFTCSRECCEDIIYKTKDGKQVWTNDQHLIPALGHDYADTKVDVTCTTPGFEHHICNNCGDEYVDGYVAPLTHTKGAHDKLEATCTEDGHDNYLCGRAGCTGYYSETVLPATGHKNKAGETIVDICTDKVTDRVCVNTNCPITPVNNKKTVGKSHDLVTDVVAPGCEHFGYELQTCANGCGEMDKVTGIVEPTGHLAPWGAYIQNDDMTAIDEDVVAYYGYEFLETDPEQYTGCITAYTAPTYEELGSVSFRCAAHCGDELTRDVIRYGVDFSMEIDNAAVAGANNIVDEEGNVIDFVPVDGDVIAVDVYMNAYKTDVWGFNFDVNYSGLSLNYLGYKFHAGDVFGVYKVNNVVTNYGSKVALSAYTENEMDGKPVDALVEGTVKVATLYFQIEAYFVDDMGDAWFDHFFWVEINDAWMSNAETEEICDGAGFYNMVSEMLDTNKNYVFNIKDLQNCYEIIKGLADVEYLAAADANKDGIVDLQDMDLMNKYLVGEATVLDVYAALNWTAPEGFVAAK